MIEGYLNGPMLLAALMAVVILELFFLVRVKRRFALNSKKDAIKSRMDGYAFLKKRDCARNSIGDESEVRSSIFLSDSMSHEVLLGTLKKVEQKSATLTMILVFALTISLGSILASGTYDQHDALPAVLCVALLMPTFYSFQGIRQVDQVDFEYPQNSVLDAAKYLQDALVDDLIKKEWGFRFSRTCTMWSVLVLLVVLSLDAIGPAVKDTINLCLGATAR